MWSAAMDVSVWLRGLGLGEYEEKFRDNKIDADVLADLTDGDLEKLGLPLGDGIVRLNSILPISTPRRCEASLILLMNHPSARRDSRPKTAYTHLP
jgi:hypothetical protein